MAPRVRKDDLEALRVLLSVEYESEDDYLKGLWVAVCERLRLRDGYGVRIDLGDIPVAYGPMYDRREATRAAELFVGAMGGSRAIVANLKAPADLDLRSADLKKYEKSCPGCGHLKLLHDWPGMKLGCIHGYEFKGTNRKPNMKGICGCRGIE